MTALLSRTVGGGVISKMVLNMSISTTSYAAVVERGT